MPCCAEGGEIFIFPSGGAEAEFTADAPHELPVLASYEPDPDLPGEQEGEHERSRLPRPWVAMVPEQELDGWLERLRARDDVAVACPNWRVSLEASREGGPRGVDFGPAGAVAYLEAQGIVLPSPGETDPTHVAVIDSGIAAGAVCCDMLSAPQLDYAEPLGGIAGPPLDEYGHGSLVASLIHYLAPSARISSIRAFGHRSTTIADVVFGLLSISQLAQPVHLVNLSFSLDASVEVCEACQHVSLRSQDVPGQMQAIFDQLGASLHPCPVFVAAAGTGALLASPASVDGVIAVDAVASRAPLASSRGKPVPGKEEFVLAPGGTRAQPIECGTAKFYGSSFAAAVLTGMLARDQGILRDSIRHLVSARWRPQRALLDRLADPQLPGYDPELHGAGLIT